MASISASGIAPVVIVGAGVIGVAVGWELQRRGYVVVLVDRADPGKGASFGNMGSIAVSEFVPASRPAMWRQIRGWILDPEGPVRLRPGYLPRLFPWLLRFAAASLPSKVRELEAAGAVLCGRVYEDYLPLLEAAGLSHMLSEQGCLSLYADDAEFAADHEHLQVIKRSGVAHEVIDQVRLRKLEPAISPSIHHAVVLPQNRSTSDPYRLVTELAAQIVGKGGRIETGEIVDFERADSAISGVQLGDGRKIPASKVVVAAGAHSARLSAKLGEPMPLETERGYHTQLMAPGVDLRYSLIWPARAFMVAPTAGDLRIGGTVEISGLDAPADYRRAKVLVKRAREALPDLKTEGHPEWMGHRPAFPDTVSVISASAKTRGLFYATAHGHLGLTYAATTSRLIADLISGAKPPVDMAPYRIDRF